MRLYYIGSIVWIMLLLIVPYSARADSPELGVKGGYQVYNNNLGSPSTFGKGVFVNIPLIDSWLFESSLLLLGEAKESNANTGAFNIAELSALYSWDLPYNQKFFLKGGAAPWFGYMTASNGGQGYEYGVSPVVGLGYSFPLYDDFYGRLEYQYFSNLGGDAIGYTDSHFVTLGLSWRAGRASLRENVDRSVTTAPHSDSYLHSKESTSERNKQNSIAVNASSVSKTTSLEREIYGSWLFDHNSSVLVIPKPFMVLDRARNMLSQGCKVSAVEVEGFADGAGEDAYNLWLSKRRASKVVKYLTHALGFEGDVVMNGFGSERSGLRADVSFYERRVDFRLNFQC
ncbi:OmpA family protein [Vibrio vulnificus]